jgi:O-antigen ligase
MTLKQNERFYRFSENAFAVNFIAFAFVMFSCWFPTGFSAVFSTFAFLFAVPLFINRYRERNFFGFELIGLTLFLWLALSILWSDGLISENFEFLFEYRFYFMLPVFISALSQNLFARRWAFYACLLGAFIAMVTSYGLGFEWWKIKGANLSLADRIYHGLIMSMFLFILLLVSREETGFVRWTSLTLAILTTLNILLIETGRTGYLQVVVVIILFILLTLSRAQSLGALIGFMLFLGSLYYSVDKFKDQIDLTVNNIEKMVMEDDYRSSVGYRLEFYSTAVEIASEHPLVGVGVGDVSSTLHEYAADGYLRVASDNIHSEFLNMMLAGGVVAFGLFFGFIIALIILGLRLRPMTTGDALVGIALVLFVSALFNSTIKDYGDKHVLMVVLSLLGSRVLAIKSLR